MIKVRFAPSPTGYLHIGGARTALFNWMYARSQGGQFILRIEDTDLERSKPEYLDEILQSMEWLGLRWDGLYKQSERFEIYREHARKLLDADKAYREGEAVILKIPPKQIKLYDIIRGEITFEAETIKDQVLLKSDGSPTYSFACVVDDALMEISHVIRGDDHISNTPKQLLIYEALGFKPPKFAHLPLIMGEDGGRLSKRTGAVAVSEYRAQGFLAAAIINYLMLLGWSPGDNQEVIAMESALKKFSIKKINKTAAVFSLDKLKWVNAQYIKNMDVADLTGQVWPLLRQRGFVGENYDGKKLENIVKSYHHRMSTLNEFLERTAYLFTDPAPISPEMRDKHLVAAHAGTFRLLSDKLAGLEPFDHASAEQAFRSVVEAQGLKAADIVHPVRVALTGSDVGPGLFETMELLGRERTVRRLSEAIKI